jgi:hypothetical protein
MTTKLEQDKHRELTADIHRKHFSNSLGRLACYVDRLMALWGGFVVCGEKMGIFFGQSKLTYFFNPNSSPHTTYPPPQTPYPEKEPFEA